ncbi:uncharacterized protein LOC131530639 isoform X2 [Onychostoma macrolepis]|uniref:uncharacterized protein LOC131530639 isoform X2 n=1 Tax=Onychostoma macrolepis TaxID=369639 RepID=UPI00272D5C78|nr:uncharacterized protein LOC131530639 isoform X2 [Onychostoma macrolepis]
MNHVFIFLFLLLCVRGHDIVPVSVIEGDSLTLYIDIETIQQEEIRWYFNDIPIADITGDQSKNCTDVQCNNGADKFRKRLKVNYMTGSLTITNIKTTDSGLYKLQINSSSNSLQLFSVSVYYAPERDTMKTKLVTEGESVVLDPVVVKTTNYLMKWLFNDIRIAEINGDLSFICTDVQCLYADVRFRDRLKLNHRTGSLTITDTRTTDSGLYYLLITTIRFSLIKSFIVNVTDVQCKYSDERFRDRLKLDHQTGSLTITNTRTTDSGLYHNEVIGGSSINHGIVSVTVREVSDAEQDEMKRKSMKVEESVTLDTGVIKMPNYLMAWYFNDIRIAEITGDQSKICTDADERFRGRLKLDHQTGSLTITNTRTTDSGDYKLQINSSRISIIKSFNVNLPNSGLSPAAVAGITGLCVGVPVVLLLVAAGWIYHRKRQAGQHDMAMRFSTHARNYN